MFKKLLCILILSFLSLNAFAARWSGTGFFIAPHGYIATAGHVVKGAKLLLVRIDKTLYVAHVIATDLKHDSAIIKIDFENIEFYKLNTEPRIGESVFLPGFPQPSRFGLGLKTTSGRVKSFSKDVIQSDVWACPGNSGSPLLNESNQAIGILVSGMPTTAEPCSKVEQSEFIYHTVLMAQKHNIPIQIDNERRKPLNLEQIFSVAKYYEVVILVIGDNKPGF